MKRDILLPIFAEPLEERLMLSVTATTARKAVRSAPSGIVVSRNHDISRLDGNQFETKIAINPADPAHVVTVGINENDNASSLFLARSDDGGATWTRSSLGSAQDGATDLNARVDPHVAYDKFGNLFICWIVAVSNSQIDVIVARSADNGKTFNTVHAVKNPNVLADAPYIATGTDSRDPTRQTIWISYTDERDGYVKVVRSVTTGRGQFFGFTPGTRINDQTGGGISTVAVGPRGQVAVSWQSPQDGSGPASIWIDYDPDGAKLGSTFSDDNLVATTNVGGADPIGPQPDRGIDAEAAVAFDCSNGPGRGRLYLVYTDENPADSDDTDILLRHSDDNGASWSRPVYVNDDHTTNSQFLPALAVDNKTGLVGVSWMDARNSPNNNFAQSYAAVSTDYGQTFLPNVRISSGTSNQAGGDTPDPPLGDLDFGDVSGLAFNNRKMIVSWADNSDSTNDNPNGPGDAFDIYTATVSVNAVLTAAKPRR